MPDGDISHETLALGNHEASGSSIGSEPEQIDLTSYKSELVSGVNVMAIEGHNLSLSSSDFSLIPELSAAIWAVCGDGAIQDGEECDDGNSDDLDGCLSSCELDTDQDGIPDTADECPETEAGGRS